MKYALIIGNNRYDDPKLAQLKTPAADSQALAKVLGDRSIGSFDEVLPLINRNESEIRRAISGFLNNKKPDDLVLVYFSGHGILDDRGRLFLSLKDTQTDLLKATAIPSTFISDEMDSCRSRRQVLILDCCHSGAFARGTKGDPKAVTEATFEGSGYGRVVMTASDSMQYALEGDQIIRQTDLSLFTHFLLEGLKTGEADMDNDGHVSLDEWYDYTYAKVISETPRQIPHRWSYNQQGDLIIARNPNAKKRVVELPFELTQAAESQFTSIRESAVHELGKLLRSRDEELANLARIALEKMLSDDSRRISNAAEKLLAEFDRSRAPTDAGQGKNANASVGPQPKITPPAREMLIPVTGRSAAAGTLPPQAASHEVVFNTSFGTQWLVTAGLAFTAAIFIYSYYSQIDSTGEILRILFGLVAGLTGLMQWYIFRNQIGIWWVPANAAAGVGLGSFQNYLFENTGWGINHLMILLAVWVVAAFSFEFLLIQKTEMASTGLSSIMETGTSQNGFRLLLSASLFAASISSILILFEVYEDYLPNILILYSISAIVASIYFFLNVKLPRNFGLLALAAFLFFDGINIGWLVYYSDYPLYYFTLNGILAMLAGIFWAFQKETWKNFGLLTLSGYLIFNGISSTVPYGSEISTSMLIISTLFSISAAILIPLRR